MEQNTDKLMMALLEALAKHEGGRDASAFMEKRKASKMPMPGEEPAPEMGDEELASLLVSVDDKKEDKEDEMSA